MTFEERKALVKSYLGKTVDIKIDRSIGYIHKKGNYSLIYPINYGYIDGSLAPDGEEQDAYILGIDHPVKEFTGQIIAIIHRQNDVEDKWVVAPEGMTFTKDQILAATHFQEQHFDITLIV